MAVGIVLLAVIAFSTSRTARAHGRRTVSTARHYGRRALAPAYSRLAASEVTEGDSRVVRPAGAEAMRDPPRRWTEADEDADESFPASDPPANY